jgi:hypothetical protein
MAAEVESGEGVAGWDRTVVPKSCDSYRAGQPEGSTGHTYCGFATSCLYVSSAEGTREGPSGWLLQFAVPRRLGWLGEGRVRVRVPAALEFGFLVAIIKGGGLGESGTTHGSGSVCQHRCACCMRRGLFCAICTRCRGSGGRASSRGRWREGAPCWHAVS